MLDLNYLFVDYYFFFAKIDNSGHDFFIFPAELISISSPGNSL